MLYFLIIYTCESKYSSLLSNSEREVAVGLGINAQHAHRETGPVVTEALSSHAGHNYQFFHAIRNN
jgi:hypothetical protein